MYMYIYVYIYIWLFPAVSQVFPSSSGAHRGKRMWGVAAMAPHSATPAGHWPDRAGTRGKNVSRGAKVWSSKKIDVGKRIS